METKGLGAGSYPEPKEIKEQTRNISINIKIECEDTFPEEWSDDFIKENIRQNINDYIKYCDLVIESIEV